MTKKYRNDNKSKILEYQKEYGKTNKNKKVEYDREYYRANRDRIAEHNKVNRDEKLKYNRGYREDNKYKMAEYRKANKDKAAEYGKEYRKANKDEIAERTNKPAIYKTYGEQLDFAEDVTDKGGFLEVSCTYCGKRFLPTVRSVRRRCEALNGKHPGECRLYCSDECKSSCPTYKKIKYPNKYRKTSSRESNSILRQMVFKRDNWICQKCGSTESLHCHHVVPARQNPMTANDPDVCTTLCKECHKEIHKRDGCKYRELRCS